MSLSQEKLASIAKKLSKLPGDNPALLQNVQDILGYMEILSEVDTTDVKPTISVVEHSAKLREDIHRPESLAKASELLDCSEQKVVSDHIVLPNIMK